MVATDEQKDLPSHVRQRGDRGLDGIVQLARLQVGPRLRPRRCDRRAFVEIRTLGALAATAAAPQLTQPVEHRPMDEGVDGLNVGHAPIALAEPAPHQRGRYVVSHLQRLIARDVQPGVPDGALESIEIQLLRVVVGEGKWHGQVGGAIYHQDAGRAGMVYS